MTELERLKLAELDRQQRDLMRNLESLRKDMDKDAERRAKWKAEEEAAKQAPPQSEHDAEAVRLSRERAEKTQLYRKVKSGERLTNAEWDRWAGVLSRAMKRAGL